MAQLNWSLSLSGMVPSEDSDALKEKVAKFVKGLNASVQSASYSTTQQEHSNLLEPDPPSA